MCGFCASQLEKAVQQEGWQEVQEETDEEVDRFV